MLPRALGVVFGLLILGSAVKTAADGYYTSGFRQEGFRFEAVLSAAAADLDGDGRDELILAGRNYLDREACAEILGWEAGSFALEWRSPNLLEPESSLLALPVRLADGPALVVLTRSCYRIFRRLDEGYAQIAEGSMPFAAEEGASADLDGDGTDELILSATLRNTKSGREKNLRVLSFSEGVFVPLVSSDPVGNVRGLAAGDLDLDGRAEVVAEIGVATKPGEFQVFRLADGALRRLSRQKVPLPSVAYGLAVGRRLSEPEPCLF
ncbi:MAG: VCBS repeat-containing protein, partial [Firmicutes bacterium]|nr:VCBS repeat-containing protein [Bacillota bacterium]